MTQIYVVGVGLAGKDSLLPQVLRRIADADVLVGSDRLLQGFHDQPGEQWPLGNFAETLENIGRYIQADPNKTVVILTTGDPLFFGLGRLLLNHFSSDQLTFIPNLSSVQLAFSRLKLPWQDATFVSVHGRDFETLCQAVRQGQSKIAVLTDPDHSPAAIAHVILALDLPIRYQAWVCENLGGTGERVTKFDLILLKDQVFASLAVLILVRDQSLEDKVDLATLPLIGIPDHLFHSFHDRPGLMTKREVRLLALGELALQSHHICWDIGAGSGSISIEMARHLSNGQVYAVEKSAAGVTLIHRNQAAFSVKNLSVTHGVAPASIQHWPRPDRIFIGGSGQKLIEILEVCQVHLNQKGRMILAIATLENLNQALTWLEAKNWQVNILHVQLSKSLPIAHLTRFQPLNPVYLITAQPST